MTQSESASGTIRTVAMCSEIQGIIEAPVQVAMLSGFDPRFVLQGISEAMVDADELDRLTTP